MGLCIIFKLILTGKLPISREIVKLHSLSLKYLIEIS